MGDIGETSITSRRIDFHLARKPFSSFTTSNGSSDFHLETLNPNVNSSKRPDLSMGKSVLAEKKSDGGDLSELGLEAELLYGITFRRIGAGLENLGNTCFLNSVLQCLTYTQPFAAYLQSGKHKSSCHIAGFCAMCAIQNHVGRALQSTGRILAPKDLVMNLRCISRNFRNARQEDAHEYMVNLLESMHKCSLPSGVPSQSPSAYEKSLVHKIFGGRLRSQVKCTQCSHCSNTFDPFLDLSLEILKADSLRKALSHFTATEQLDGGERQYHCQRCKQKVRALKQLTVHKAPYVLTVHLKRFGGHVPGQKINKKVEFSPTLNLKPFVSGSYEGDLNYTLYGVLVHAGWSTHSGHYYCFVRTSTGMWHSLDDNRVVQVSEKTVLEQKAYMLFYVRDIKNLSLKKPVNDVRKENLTPSGSGNKGTLQTGPVAKTLNASACSSAAAVTQSLGSSLKEAQLNEASQPEIKVPDLEKKSDLLKNPPPNSLKEHAMGPSTDGQLVKKDSRPSVLLLGKGTVSTSQTVVNDARDNSKENSCITVPGPLASIKDQNSGSKMLVAVKVTEQVCDIVDKGMLIELSNQSGSESNQDKVILSEKGSSDKLLQKAKENGVSSQLSMISKSVQKKDIDVPKHKKGLKPKKKLMKFHSGSLVLSSKLMIKASLGIRKKKKEKRNKKPSSDLRKSTKGDLDFPSKIQGQLAAKEIMQADLHSAHPQRHIEKSAKKDGLWDEVVSSPQNNSKTNTMKGDFKERICLNAAVLATNELPKESPNLASAPTKLNAREPDCSQQKVKDQNGLMNLLTRGLEDTTVARWDGTESRSSNLLGSSAPGSISIGYVPDEWDEEYDKGKRKKVREHKDEFGGPNPFQEIASMKARVNKKQKKMDKSSSANQPFRI